MRKKVVLIILFSLLAISLVKLAIDIRWFCHNMSIVSIYAEAYSSTFSPDDFERITILLSKGFIKNNIINISFDLIWLVFMVVAIIKIYRYKEKD